jgi:hypothetical protein
VVVDDQDPDPGTVVHLASWGECRSDRLGRGSKGCGRV